MMCRHGSYCAAALTAFAGITAAARADLVYLTQQRSITAATSANGQTLTVSAADFGPFVQNLLTSTPFNQQGGGTGNNSGGSTIDCQLDPNTVRANGRIRGEGGTDDNGTSIFGEGSVLIDITFQIDSATPYSLLALARPATSQVEEFEIKLRDLATNIDLFELDNTMSPQDVDVGGVLQPGTYRIKYHVETIITGPLQESPFSFEFTVPSPGPIVLLAAAPVVLRRRRR